LGAQNAGARHRGGCYLDVAGTRLCAVNFGGGGLSILLLHGLAGRANEWRSTVSWLTAHGHVWALDQCGHGMGDKSTGDYSRARPTWMM